MTIQPASILLCNNLTQTFPPWIFQPKYFWTILLFWQAHNPVMYFLSTMSLMWSTIVTCNKTSTLGFLVCDCLHQSCVEVSHVTWSVRQTEVILVCLGCFVDLVRYGLLMWQFDPSVSTWTFGPKYFGTNVLFNRPTIQSHIFCTQRLLCGRIVTCNELSTLSVRAVTVYIIKAGSKCHMSHGQSDRIDRHKSSNPWISTLTYLILDMVSQTGQQSTNPWISVPCALT
jgi:hypothetical protein